MVLKVLNIKVILTVVLVIMIGGWNGYLSLSNMSKLKRSIDLSNNFDLIMLLSISNLILKVTKYLYILTSIRVPIYVSFFPNLYSFGRFLSKNISLSILFVLLDCAILIYK